MSNQIMIDKYILGQSLNQSITSLGQEIKLDVSLKDNPYVFNGGKISGIVTDTNNTPISNAVVKIMSSDYQPLMHTITNSIGQYSFINVPPNTSYNIFAIAPGMQLQQGNHFTITNLEQLTINFVLQNDPAMSLGIIAGDIIDYSTNAPINGAIVTLFQNQQNANNILEAIVYSNQYGQFVFREVPIGNYTITISALGYNDNDISASIDNGGGIASVNISLTPSSNTINGTVSGMITDSNNQPVDRADVILYSVDSNNNLTPISFTKTNLNGIYLFDNVPVGNYKVKANEIELITDNGTIWEYSPYFDSFTIATPLSFNPMALNMTTGSNLTNNANLVLDGKFIGGLGGSSNGTASNTVTVQSAGLYNLAVTYLSGDKALPIKVDVNNAVSSNVFIATKTTDWNPVNVSILNIPVMFTSGSNTINFYNDTGENAPYISIVNISLMNPYLTLNSTIGTLSSGATQTIQGQFIGNLGDTNGGYVTLDVNVYTFGEYNLNIQYLSGDNNTTLEMDVNGLNTGITYSFNKTVSWNATDAGVLNTTVNLMAGDNTIKLYNNLNSKSPWIGNMTFSPISIAYNYNATLGILSKGASLSFNNSMVSNIGGPQNGTVNLTINTPVTGNYILGIQYLTGVLTGSPLKINVNSNLIGSYMAPYTGNNQLSNSKILNVKIPLNQGGNNFSFYNDTGIFAPSIGRITLILIDDLEITTSAINGIRSGSANLIWNNQFVGGIGGSGNGTVAVTVPSLVTSDYIMSFSYLTQDVNSKNLKINIGSNLINSYILPQTNYTSTKDAQNYDILISLNEGNNTIEFYNDTGVNAPDIGEIIFTRLTSFRNDILAGTCSLNGNVIVKNGLVTGISSSGGELILEVTVPQSGQYDLTINYAAGDDNSQTNIDVNGINTGETYTFSPTGSWDLSTVSSKTINITLKEGINSISFYNTL